MNSARLPKLKTLGLGAAGLLVFGLIWEAVGRSGLLPPFVAPPPSAIPTAAWREITGGFWIKAIAGSASHYFLGLLLGSGLGILLGVLAGLSRVWEAAQQWLVRVLRPIPGIAWIPFAIIWFGVSEGAAIFIIAIGVFWITYFSAFAAVRGVDPDLIEVAAAFGHGSAFARITKIILPAAAPGILGGVRIALGQGWMAVVAAELFGIPGIGSRMTDASGLLNTPVVIVYMLTIAALYSLTDVVFGMISRGILRWQR